MLKEITDLRRKLHMNPELSGDETETAALIKNFVKTNHSTQIIEGLGGNGLAVVYTFSEDGPSVMIRCELDALPIEEINTFEYRSLKPGVSHKCGHDGHMAIVAGLIFKIKEQHYKRGKIILLFQPAEETGKGAYDVLNDPKFKNLDPDYIFALHNIPGVPLNSIINIKGPFSSTVQSLAIYFTGKQSHASEPENGINPASAIAELVQRFKDLNEPNITNDHFALLTPVYMNLGTKDYGISAGKGELHFTLRTKTENVMEQLKTSILNLMKQVCEEHQLQYKTDWFDYFPATVNNEECYNMILRAAATNKYELLQRESPFRFGEDFGWFSKNSKAAMFGLGAGMNSPALHHEDYDFPEELLETGINMFSNIILQALTNNENDKLA
ncbi:MAG TPA: amidohydrolase [Gillisia sp.]|nr:amidohydrolase [Gillisia sp.]